MPDGDVISRGVRFAWRSAYEGLQAKESVKVVVGRLAKAIARSLRVSGGLPSFSDVAVIVRHVRTGELSPADAFTELRRLDLRSDSHRALVIREAQRCIVSPPNDIDAARDLANGIVSGLAEAQVLSKAVPRLVSDGIASQSDALVYLQRVREAALPDFARIAEQLAANPVGQHFRAPSHRGVRKSTSDMLDDSII